MRKTGSYPDGRYTPVNCVLFPTLFSLAEILVIVGGAIPPAPTSTRISARLNMFRNTVDP